MKYSIENKYLKVDFLPLGATILRFFYKPYNRNIVLTNKDKSNYKSGDYGYFGATIGRIAGRIKPLDFTYNNTQYNIKSNKDLILHSGKESYAFKKFDVLKHKNNEIIFSYVDKDTIGYQGILYLIVKYKLVGSSLKLDYYYSSDTNTIASITNHSYFNLDASNTISKHQLKIEASSYYELDEKLIPTSKLLEPKYMGLNNGITKLGDALEYTKDNLNHGIDNYFITPKKRLSLIGSDLILDIKYNYPGTILYTSNMPSNQELEDNTKYNLHRALAIEPSIAPNAINLGLDDMKVLKNKKYHKKIVYTIRKK